jgi:hypothetical protein
MFCCNASTGDSGYIYLLDSRSNEWSRIPVEGEDGVNSAFVSKSDGVTTLWACTWDDDEWKIWSSTDWGESWSGPTRYNIGVEPQGPWFFPGSEFLGDFGFKVSITGVGNYVYYPVTTLADDDAPFFELESIYPYKDPATGEVTFYTLGGDGLDTVLYAATDPGGPWSSATVLDFGEAGDAYMNYKLDGGMHFVTLWTDGGKVYEAWRAGPDLVFSRIHRVEYSEAYGAGRVFDYAHVEGDSSYVAVSDQDHENNLVRTDVFRTQGGKVLSGVYAVRNIASFRGALYAFGCDTLPLLGYQGTTIYRYTPGVGAETVYSDSLAVETLTGSYQILGHLTTKAVKSLT